MCDACAKNQKEIEELKRKIQELEKSKEFSLCDSVKEVILAEIKKTNEQLIEIKKAIKENDKSTSNKSLLSDFKWLLPIIAIFIIGLGISLIPINKNIVAGSFFIFIGILAVLILVLFDISNNKQKGA